MNKDITYKFTKKDWYIITLLVCMFVALRLVFAIFSPYAYHEEEIKQATLALDILRGKLQMPFWCYMDSPHSGGSILAGLTMVPFFLLFGKQLLTLKFAALLYATGLFACMTTLLKKYYTWKNIILPLILLCVFSTPHYLQRNMFLLGNTVEFLCVAFLFIWLIDHIVINNKKQIGWFLLLGIIAGLGLWIQYLFIAFIGAFALFWALQKEARPRIPTVFVFIAGFCIGFLPWIIYNILYGFPSIWGDLIAPEQSLSSLWGIAHLSRNNFIQLMRYTIPRSFHFFSISRITSPYISYVFYGLFLLSFLYLLCGIFCQQKKNKLHLMMLILYSTSIIVCSLKKFLCASNSIGIWGSSGKNLDFYQLFLQPTMFIIMIMAYAEVRQHKYIRICTYIYYLLIPLMVIQFYCLLEPHSKDASLNQDISATRSLSNAFESGSHFVLIRSPLWETILHKIPHTPYRKEYIKGSLTQIANVPDFAKIYPDRNTIIMHESSLITDKE